MKIVSKSSKTGVALIMVMVAIFALSVLVGAFAYAMKVETKLAQTANNGETLIWLGRSGVEQAKAILAQVNCRYEARNQKWAGGSGSECETNGAFTDLPMDNVPLGEGTFSIKITDLESKININSASEALIRNAIESIGLSQGEAAMVQDGILDWMDPNPNSNIKRPNGAKTDFYQSLEPPYNAKNGPVDDISELLLIRGVTQDIFWGPASTNHSEAYFQRLNQPRRGAIQQPLYSAGLEDIFTTMGGPVNVNTASREVLLAIPGINETIADQIIQNRSEAPFINVGETINAGAPPAIGQYCGVNSRTFAVQVNAEVGGTRRTFYAVVGRAGPKNFQVLSFYWK